MIRMLQDLTGIDPLEIPLDSREVMSLFKDTSALGITPEDIGGCKLGALGIPEFGTDFAMQMLIDTKPQYLPNVVEYSRQDAEIWVADNNSSDQSMLLLETQFPHVKTIVLEQNFGFAEGYNRALEQIEAEYYVLLNSDVEVAHHWLTPLIEFMDSHPQVAACQPKLLAEYDKDMFEYAGACGGFLHSILLNLLAVFIEIMLPCLESPAGLEDCLEVAQVVFQDQHLESSQVIQEPPHPHFNIYLVKTKSYFLFAPPI